MFTQVLFICDRQGLIGREMFAIDGVKLPSNASKASSGTRADFERQAAKLEAAVRDDARAPPRAGCQGAVEPDLRAKEAERLERLKRDAAQIRTVAGARTPRIAAARRAACARATAPTTSARRWPPARACSRATPAWRRSTRAIRSSSRPRRTARQRTGTCWCRWWTRSPTCIEPDTLITADAGYHSDANLQALAEREIEALIADNGMRQRDERFADTEPAQGLAGSAARQIGARHRRRRGTLRPTSATTRRRRPASARPASSSIATAVTA